MTRALLSTALMTLGLVLGFASVGLLDVQGPLRWGLLAGAALLFAAGQLSRSPGAPESLSGAQGVAPSPGGRPAEPTQEGRGPSLPAQQLSLPTQPSLPAQPPVPAQGSSGLASAERGAQLVHPSEPPTPEAATAGAAGPELEALRAHVQRLEGQLAEAEAGLDRREQALLAAQQEIHELEDDVSNDSDRSAALQAELSAAQEVISTQRGQLSSAAELAQKAAARIHGLEAALTQVRSQAQEVARARGVLEQDLQHARDEAGEVERTLSQRLAAEQTQKQDLEGAIQQTRASRAALEARLQQLEAKREQLQAANEAQRQAEQALSGQVQALEAGRLGQQRELDRLAAALEEKTAAVREAHQSGERWRLRLRDAERQLAHLGAEALADHGAAEVSVQALSDAMDALNLPAMLVTHEGLVACLTPALAELLEISVAEAVGLDEWTFGTELLEPRARDPEQLRARQAELLDAPAGADVLALAGGESALRWHLPLRGGGRAELWAPALAQAAPDKDLARLLGPLESLLQSLERSPAAASASSSPSANTTLQALRRQLVELEPLLPPGEAGTEARARLSTARALISTLLNSGDVSADAGQQPLEQLGAALGPLRRAVGQLRDLA